MILSENANPDNNNGKKWNANSFQSEQKDQKWSGYNPTTFWGVCSCPCSAFLLLSEWLFIHLIDDMSSSWLRFCALQHAKIQRHPPIEVQDIVGIDWTFSRNPHPRVVGTPQLIQSHQSPWLTQRDLPPFGWWGCWATFRVGFCIMAMSAGATTPRRLKYFQMLLMPRRWHCLWSARNWSYAIWFLWLWPVPSTLTALLSWPARPSLTLIGVPVIYHSTPRFSSPSQVEQQLHPWQISPMEMTEGKLKFKYFKCSAG